MLWSSAARFTFDAAYDGTGNWPFNTAYAAHFGLDAFVTRLRSLHEAELFLAAGIPLVASIAAGPGELDGFLLPQGTAGHLVVIVGFTDAGRPDRQRSGGALERRCAPHLRPGAVRARLARGLRRSGLRDHAARHGAAASPRQLVGDGSQRTSNVAAHPAGSVVGERAPHGVAAGPQARSSSPVLPGCTSAIR